MKPKLVAVEGTPVARPRWRPKAQQVVGGAVFCGGLALGYWQWFGPEPGPGANDIVLAGLLAVMVALVWDHGRRNPQPPPREPDQLIRHEHIRRWF